MKLKKIVFLFHLTSKSVEFIDLFNTPKVTYKGDRDIIKSNVAMLITDIALINASLIMFQKIANILSIVSFVLVSSVIGGGYFGYKYITSEQFQTKIMNKVLGGVGDMMPKVLDEGLPEMVQPSIDIPDGFGI